MSEIKDFVKSLNGKPILIYGLGKTGNALVRALHDAGAALVIGDDKAENLGSFSKLDNVRLIDMDTQDFSALAFLVLSPGIPYTHPVPHDVVTKTQNAGIEVISDIELFFRIHPDLKSIAVTGTNGKSTTVSLISHILTEAGIKNALGGNIGTAMFDLKVEGENKPEWIVLEMSSYQIDLCPTFRPDISAILNVTPDHLDRHGTIENYAAVKERLFEPKTPEIPGVAVICTDDEYTRVMARRTKKAGARKVIEVSATTAQDYLGDVGDLSELKALKGEHNHQNIICVYAALRTAGVSPELIWRGMQSFPGLDHRQYLVRIINDIPYINDSKATNAASTEVALNCRENIYWIVGGRQKKTGLSGLEKYTGRINHAFLIGECAEEFAMWCKKNGVEYTVSHTLDKALAQAHTMAQQARVKSGKVGVVLLSPACASWDQYASFEKRGEHFADLVNALENGA